MGFAEAQYGADEGISGVAKLLQNRINAMLVCKSTIAEDEGKTITVSDGTNAYTGKFNANLECSFDIPGRTAYRVMVSSDGVTEFEAPPRDNRRAVRVRKPIWWLDPPTVSYRTWSICRISTTSTW